MGAFPFFRFPYYSYYNRRNYINKFPIKSEVALNTTASSDSRGSFSPKDVHSSIECDFEPQKRTTKNGSFANFNISSLFSSDLNKPILEILGISLYLDDILIIGLLFFLYTEGVKDELLFICLILLLLG